MRVIDLMVSQKEHKIEYNCPNCCDDIEIDFTEFLKEHGETDSWQFLELECPTCDEAILIDRVINK